MKGHWALIMWGRVLAEGVTCEDALAEAERVDPERRQRTMIVSIGTLQELREERERLVRSTPR